MLGLRWMFSKTNHTFHKCKCNTAFKYTRMCTIYEIVRSISIILQIASSRKYYENRVIFYNIYYILYTSKSIIRRWKLYATVMILNIITMELLIFLWLWMQNQVKTHNRSLSKYCRVKYEIHILSEKKIRKR